MSVENLKQEVLAVTQEVEDASPRVSAYSTEVTELKSLEAQQVAGMEEVISMLGAVIGKVAEVAAIGSQAKQTSVEVRGKSLEVDREADKLKLKLMNVLTDTRSLVAGQAIDSMIDVYNSAATAAYQLSTVEGRIHGNVDHVIGLQTTIEFVQGQAANMKSQMESISKQISEADKEAGLAAGQINEAATHLRTYGESL